MIIQYTNNENPLYTNTENNSIPNLNLIAIRKERKIREREFTNREIFENMLLMF